MNKFNNDTWWDRFLFKVFGETNFLLWWYGGAIFLVVAFWAFVIYVIAHFVMKYW